MGSQMGQNVSCCHVSDQHFLDIPSGPTRLQLRGFATVFGAAGPSPTVRIVVV